MKNTLNTLTLILLFSLSSYAAGDKEVSNTANQYSIGTVYKFNGSKYRFIGYDENKPTFEGVTFKLPNYKGVKRNISKRNRKALNNLKK
jgi:hypothetical protein